MSCVLNALARARRIAEHAETLGLLEGNLPTRQAQSHLGAVLADSVLQAGLSYRSVVLPRVRRIIYVYPQAAQLAGILEIVANGDVADFLAWTHPTKLARFTDLTHFCEEREIQDVFMMQSWLAGPSATSELQTVKGVGPKTVDYLACLVGADRIAVDRHVLSFTAHAGVEADGYDDVQTIVSYAADLLGIRRRDFDAWIWAQYARKQPEEAQPDLLASLH
jgi:hypothetical protein